jgi:23S rRNA (uracil1939-C5)-methyltransferase
MITQCRYQDLCSGCQSLGVPLADQHGAKRAGLAALLQAAGLSVAEPIEVVSPGASGLRDRVDLVYDHGALGLYSHEAKKILDLEECPQFSPALHAWYEEVRKIRWPIQKGSLRLRVGPQGRKGLWLDFANVDIKNILDEKTLLQKLQGLAFVEIGQRRKVPVLVGDTYKLKDPDPQVWFQTWIEDQPVDLFCSVGSFTQPSLLANRDLIRVIQGWLDKIDAKNILEFGSGIGNLSFPALGRDRHLTACEIDEGALLGFQKSLNKLALTPAFADCGERVRLVQGDFQNKNPQDFEKYDLVLANPPRSGLKSFLNPLIGAKNKPAYFLYMSCFPESFIEDGKRLAEAGYRITELKIVDQFPQTDHYEVLSLWRL